MPGFAQKIINLLSYKEPKNKERGFELLEDEDEDIKAEGSQHTTTENDSKSPNTHENKKDSGKSSLSVEEWNKSRKNENIPKPKEDADAVSKDLSVNLEIIKKKFRMSKNQGILIREFTIGRKVEAFMVFITGMVDKKTLNLAIFPQLMAKDIFDELGDKCPVDFLIKNILTVHSVNRSKKISDIIMQVLTGEGALFIEGCDECILLNIKGYEKRSVEQPITETVVNGSQEGLTEDLNTNITLIRRIIKNENLVTEIEGVGDTNHSKCAIIYMEGIANPKVVGEVKKRIKSISTDFVMGDGMIEQFIEDNPFMLFPQVVTTERPDRAVSFIMEGQVVIMGEGTPFCIAVPVTFFRMFHTSEDSFARWPFGTFLRFIRMVGLFCATLLPGLYTAAVLFHTEMIPTELLTSITKAKEQVPFPTLLEVLMMELAFELIREGGIRVPSVIGQTLGIVGALILGQAAVAAGLVSPLLVIIVSVTALGSFAIPNYSMALAIRIERFLFIFAGAYAGFYGISFIGYLLAILACSMKSFGVPYFAPVAPRTKINPDVVIRYPIWMQRNRPDGLNTLNKKRQGDNKMWISEENQDDKRGGNNS